MYELLWSFVSVSFMFWHVRRSSLTSPISVERSACFSECLSCLSSSSSNSRSISSSTSSSTAAHRWRRGVSLPPSRGHGMSEVRRQRRAAVGCRGKHRPPTATSSRTGIVVRHRPTERRRECRALIPTTFVTFYSTCKASATRFTTGCVCVVDLTPDLCMYSRISQCSVFVWYDSNDVSHRRLLSLGKLNGWIAVTTYCW